MPIISQLLKICSLYASLLSWLRFFRLQFEGSYIIIMSFMCHRVFSFLFTTSQSSTIWIYQSLLNHSSVTGRVTGTNFWLIQIKFLWTFVYKSLGICFRVAANFKNFWDSATRKFYLQNGQYYKKWVLMRIYGGLRALFYINKIRLWVSKTNLFKCSLIALVKIKIYAYLLFQKFSIICYNIRKITYSVCACFLSVERGW